MPRVASIIPPVSKGTATLSTGTKVLLDNGEYLQHVNKITLVAEPGQPWKAIIEVHPTNQEQIDALLSDLEMVKRYEASNRLAEIKEEMQRLQDEKLFLEYKYLSGVAGVSVDGVKDVPKEGTWLLHGHETVLTPQQNESLKEILNINSGLLKPIPPASEKVKDIHGVIHSRPDPKGEKDD
ncbi:hypothetical protein [Acinetobacter baumannii]|uniref:hypothetical protein n=1 Tax=Acinetobacter baumannii TaxID=470 RepID=UPI000DEC62B5|nr:hypothetical protein [Acinetobacter baumannii]EHU1961522.1 hypothetical protein [Acinetobacter baumannii]MBF8379849.1 hypothetical protein [Acinetobacter baumannii]MBJ3827426.1 hypothetical protein [Acinetobacter baumannii]MBP3075274.1 hypothetical protein [Acinetobacter baumannii]MBP5081274.1 hypothetical protein [Acinetobacter baumannii]